MIYDNAVDEMKGMTKNSTDPVVLATVTSVSDNNALVQFYGENSPSSVYYKKLSSYSPTVNDTVVLLKKGNSYIILGKIV